MLFGCAGDSLAPSKACFQKYVRIDGTLAENRLGLQRNDCWEYIICVHYFWTELLCYAACVVIWSAPYQYRQSHSAWPLASKHCHKPSHQLDDDLPTHGSNSGTEPAAGSKKRFRHRGCFQTPGGKKSDQKLLTARILTEKYPRWCIWNFHILRFFRIRHRAPIKKCPGVVYAQKTRFLLNLSYTPAGTFL